MSNSDDVEHRLRTHLGRVAEKSPSSDFEGQIIARAMGRAKPEAAQFNWSRATMLVVLTALTLLLVLALSGHESSNVFSNISNGLNTH